MYLIFSAILTVGADFRLTVPLRDVITAEGEVHSISAMPMVCEFMNPDIPDMNCIRCLYLETGLVPNNSEIMQQHCCCFFFFF